MKKIYLLLLIVFTSVIILFLRIQLYSFETVIVFTVMTIVLNIINLLHIDFSKIIISILSFFSLGLFAMSIIYYINYNSTLPESPGLGDISFLPDVLFILSTMVYIFVTIIVIVRIYIEKPRT